jgi:putative SOS response-associated peptidase YedK
VDSLGNGKLRGIWHERCPVILTEAQLEEWLDPRTTPERALQMCLVFPADRMEVEEVPKEAPQTGKRKKDDPDGETLRLPL